MNTQHCVLISLLCLAFAGCQETILHDLEESQVNQVIIALSQRGIEAEKQREGAQWNLAVSSADTDRALRTIETTRILSRARRARVPQRSNSLLQTAEDRARSREQELSAHLEKTIERFPGVLEARVHLNLSAPPSISLLDDTESDSASVLLVTLPETAPPEKDLQRIVSGASGVLPKKISVVAVVARQDDLPNISSSERMAIDIEEKSSNSGDQTPDLGTSNTKGDKTFEFRLPPWTSSKAMLVVVPIILLLLLTNRRLRSEGPNPRENRVEPLRPPKSKMDTSTIRAPQVERAGSENGNTERIAYPDVSMRYANEQ